MKLALLGGTFNPIHNGHLFIAEEVLRSLGYDRVVFVPSFKPAHKEISAEDDPEKRLAMVRLAIGEREEFLVDDCELQRRGTSYTMETIDYLNRKHRIDGRIGLIIGDDLVAGFGKWKMVDRLLSEVDIIIARRISPEKVEFPGPAAYLENALLPISSSDIRERVRTDKAFRYLVPEEVYLYIVKERLYRDV